MNKENYSWVPFYKEFAITLLKYKNNRARLINIIKNTFVEIDLDLPTLERNNDLFDIDPFTVFGLFNKSSMKEVNRIKILKSLANKLSITTKIPTDFDSIPVLNNQNATFYWFVGSRGEEDIDELWELFESALNYVSNISEITRKKLIKYFDLAINKKGNGNSKITMGLYWIAPDVFLNLDRRNIWFIYESGKLPKEFVDTLPLVDAKISGEKYFTIVEKLQQFIKEPNNGFNSFKELSNEAWNYSTQVNQEKKEAELKSERDSKSSALADEDIDTTHYWLYSPGDYANKWDEYYNKGIMAIGWGEIGDLRQYSSKNEMKNAMKDIIDPNFSYMNAGHATWQFANEIKPGDIIFVKKGLLKIIGRGVVESDYEFDESINDEYKNVRKVKWLDKGEWNHPGHAVMKTLTDITQYTDYVEKLKAMFVNDEIIEEEKEKQYPKYTSNNFLNDVYMNENKYYILVGLLKTKKNIILQGAPGVGKTYAAKRLAYSIMGVKDTGRVAMVQFHQSYSYEDFVEGFRPTSTGMNFDIKKGVFYNFCNKAREDLENDYFFIIDEINRGNLSKIFGELFMLIEADKRGHELPLLYSDDKFSVPSNVHIIGLMNTADRSLAMLDYALRRRFAFFTIEPGFNSIGFINYKNNLNYPKLNRLINVVEKLNNEIISDESLGDGFCIGHSFFCDIKKVDDQILSNIVEYELIPLLKEYWFDEPSKVKDWSRYLMDALK